MNLIGNLIEKLQRHPKRFVFADGADVRVLQAARQIVSRGMGVPVLLGDRAKVKQIAARFDLSTKGIRIIEPARSSELETFAHELQSLSRFSDLSEEELLLKATDPHYFAALMVRANQVEAYVSGAQESASCSLRPLLQLIGTQEGVATASSLLVMELEAKNVGIDGALFMGDCGVIPDPTSEQLADIAITTAALAAHLTGHQPKVAMLSFSTHGDCRHASVAKVQRAVGLARERIARQSLDIEIAGDIQIDAALDSATAKVKGLANNPVAGKANVLVFPDLNSGNIATKLVHILSGANKYGQILTGLRSPAAEVSRGASAHDILGASAIIGCQAIDRSLLF